MHFYSFLQQSEATGTYTKEWAVQLQETIFFVGSKAFLCHRVGDRHIGYMGLTDFGSILFRYRLLWHSAYYLASQVTVLLPNRPTRATFLCMLLRKQPFQKKPMVQDVSLQVSTETRHQVWGEPILTVMVRSEEMQNRGWDQLTGFKHFCIQLKFWFAFSNYQGSSVKVLLPFYKILQNSVCRER